MPKLAINSAGLGDVVSTLVSAYDANAPSLTSSGWVQQCGLSFASYLTNPSCWGNSYDQWTQAFYGLKSPASPVAPAAPSTVYTNPDQVVPDTTGQTGQDLSNAAISATQGANQAIIASEASNSPWFCSVLDCDANGNPSLDSTNLAWLLVGAAVALFAFKGIVK